MLKIDQLWYDFYQASPFFIKNVMASTYAYWSGRKKYGGVYGQWMHSLDESRLWDAGRLREYQELRLRELLSLVQTQSPWYAAMMRQHNIDPSSNDILRELKKFPPTNKMVVRENHEQITTGYAREKRLVFTTSGTTGASLRVPMTEEALQREYAYRWHHLGNAAGARRNDPFAYFTGHSIVPVGTEKPPFHIHNYAEHAVMFSLYHMSDTTIRSYAGAFNAFAPRFVFGYPSGIYVFAGLILKHQIPIVAPKAIFTGSEKLHDFERRHIEKAFQAPVFEWYGQVELTANLQECSHHRLHVMETYGYLELLKEDGTEAGPGETGSAVATGWGNKAFPLIRYDTGDLFRLAAEQRCACRRAGRIVEEIIGRDDDIIVTPEGNQVVALGWVFHALESIREGQIVQESLDRMVIRLVPMENYTEADGEKITARLRQRVGPSMAIRVELVPGIERSANGKFRYVVSRIRKNGSA